MSRPGRAPLRQASTSALNLRPWTCNVCTTEARGPPPRSVRLLSPSFPSVLKGGTRPESAQSHVISGQQRDRIGDRGEVAGANVTRRSERRGGRRPQPARLQPRRLPLSRHGSHEVVTSALCSSCVTIVPLSAILTKTRLRLGLAACAPCSFPSRAIDIVAVGLSCSSGSFSTASPQR